MALTLLLKRAEYSAQLVRDRPGRLGFFAAVSLPDTDGGPREIACAVHPIECVRSRNKAEKNDPDRWAKRLRQGCWGRIM